MLNHIYQARVEDQQIRDFCGLMFYVGFNRLFEKKPQKNLRKALKMGPQKAVKIDLEKVSQNYNFSKFFALRAYPPTQSSGSRRNCECLLVWLKQQQASEGSNKQQQQRE